jgi:redox-sensing transcriptional repressor
LKSRIAISKATIDRLPVYFRTLKVTQLEGVEIISSEELGKRIGVTPEQIRKDLASFGQFGKKGVGYYVGELIRNIGEILGLHRKWNMAIVGLGHLGWALANYPNFSSLGFNMKALFDIDLSKIGLKLKGVEVSHNREIPLIIAERNIHIAVVTVPAEQAQLVTNQLIAANIKGIWNFAPVQLKVPSNIIIVSEDLSVGLSSLSYHLTRSLPDSE